MGAEDKIGLQLAGIEFLPPDLFLDDAETIRRLLEAADSGQFDPAQLPFPKLPIRQIFADPQGDHYLVVPTTGDSPVALPYITGSELGTLADMRQGGFISMDALSKFSPPKPSADGFPDPAALMGQFTTDIVKSVAAGGSVTGAMLGQLQSQLTGLALSHVPEEFRGIARQALNQGLEYGPKLLDGLMSGGLSGAIKNPLANVSMGDVSDMAVGGLADMGFSALADAWKVDDSSSTLEQVAHKYGMQALGMMKGYITQQMQSFVKDAISGQLDTAMNNLSSGLGGSLTGFKKWFNDFFNGMSSGAVLPAAHKDSKDDKVDVVITGFPTVLVGGKPISRITDLLDPSKKIILEGAATVLAGGMPVGRVTSDTAIPSDLLTGAATVLIGGPSVKISPPIAPKGGAGGGAGGGQAAGSGAGKGDSSSSGGENDKGSNGEKGAGGGVGGGQAAGSGAGKGDSSSSGGENDKGSNGEKKEAGESSKSKEERFDELNKKLLEMSKNSQTDQEEFARLKRERDEFYNDPSLREQTRNYGPSGNIGPSNKSNKDLGEDDNPVREFPIREGGLLGGDNAVIKPYEGPRELQSACNCFGYYNAGNDLLTCAYDRGIKRNDLRELAKDEPLQVGDTALWKEHGKEHVGTISGFDKNGQPIINSLIPVNNSLWDSAKRIYPGIPASVVVGPYPEAVFYNRYGKPVYMRPKPPEK